MIGDLFRKELDEPRRFVQLLVDKTAAKLSQSDLPPDTVQKFTEGLELARQTEPTPHGFKDRGDQLVTEAVDKQVLDGFGLVCNALQCYWEPWMRPFMWLTDDVAFSAFASTMRELENER